MAPRGRRTARSDASSDAPPPVEWSDGASDALSESDDAWAASEDGGSDEERRSAAHGCCRRRTQAASPARVERSNSGKHSEALSAQPTSKEAAALERKLRDIEALEDDDVPSVLYTAPSRSLALEHAEAHQPRFKATDGEWYAYDVLRTTAQQIGRAFGAGYGAWFVQLEFMQVLFAVLTVFALPSMYFIGWAAVQTNTRTSDLLLGRLLRWASYSTVRSLSVSHDAGGRVSRVTLETITLIHTCLDVVATEVFLIGLEYLRRRARSQNLVAGKARASVTLAPFSIMVEGLPEDLAAVDEVEDYFSRYGDVADVVLTTTSVNLLQLEAKHAAAVDVLEDFRAKVAKTGGAVHGRGQVLQARIDAIAAQIQDFVQRPHECTGAFVTFEKAEAAKEALTSLTWYEFSCGGAERFRGTHVLRVKRAPESSDILWENTVHGSTERMLRTWVTVGASCLLLGVAAWLVSWRAQLTPELLRDVDCSQVVGSNQYFDSGRLPVTLNCPVLFPLSDPASVPIVLSTLAQLSASVSPASCDPFIRQEAFKPDVMNADSASLGARVAAGLFANNTASFMQGSTQDICAAAVCHACFCRENMLAAGGGGFGTGLPGESVCTAYSAAFYAQDRLRYIILGISIATMTLLLTTARPLSTQIERHVTRGALEASCATRLALALVCAAYLVPLIGYSIHGRYVDFTDAWYNTAGAVIVCTTTFMALFLPFGLWLTALCTSLSRHLTLRPLRQATFDAAYVLPRFRLAERYGVLLAVVFSALLISPGCPFVYLALQLYALCAVRLDRHVLLRLSSVPDPLSAVLAERVSSLLPLSVWLHLLVGFWMLATQTMPNYFMAWDPDPVADQTDYVPADRFDLQHRLNRMNGLIYFVVLLVFTVWVAPLTFWLRNAACCCGDPQSTRRVAPKSDAAPAAGAVAVDVAPDSALRRTWASFTAVVKRVRPGPGMDFSYAVRKKCLYGLPSYRIIDNPEYLGLIGGSGVLTELQLLALQPYLERRVRTQSATPVRDEANKRTERDAAADARNGDGGANIFAYPPISAPASTKAHTGGDEVVSPLLSWLPQPPLWWPFKSGGPGSTSHPRIPEFDAATTVGGRGSTTVLMDPPPPPPDRWTPLHERGEAYRARGRLAEAEGCLRRAYVSRLRVLGELHAATVASATSLASVLQAQGRLTDAEPLLRDTSRVRDLTLGASHPISLAAANALGSALYGQAKYPEAEALFRRVLDGRAAALGAQPPDVAVAASNLGSCLYAQARLEEAEAQYRRALEVRTAALPDRHPETLASAVALGSLLQARGGEARLLDAETLLRGALRGRRAALGPAHPETLAALAALASVLQDQGALGEAERLHAECLRGRRAVLGEAHPDTLASLNNLAACLADQGRLAQAEPLYAAALRGMTSSLGASHPDTLAAAKNLSALLETLGTLRAGDAPLSSARLVLLADKLRDLRLSQGSGHPETLTAANDLACALAEQGRAADAEALFVEVLDARRESLGPGHPATLTSANNLGRLRLDQGNLDEAELLLRTALKGRAHHFGAEDADAVVSARNLRETLAAKGHPDPDGEVERLITAALRPRRVKPKRKQAAEQEPPPPSPPPSSPPPPSPPPSPPPRKQGAAKSKAQKLKGKGKQPTRPRAAAPRAAAEADEDA